MKKNSLSRIVVFTWFLTLVLGFDLKAQNDAEAGKWLDEASETMSRYENISVDFDYVLDNRSEDVTQELSGSVLLQGEMYVVNLFGSTQIYDGNNTYTIIPENEEVNISDEMSTMRTPLRLQSSILFTSRDTPMLWVNRKP